ncbi:alpha/beta fold hydrolase [Agaribacterium haliotis]|uniref:alpha/beta fold hydrolase n=1 Tax=Agaribacterium haliotis TaxID=2013869 RepID=UPI000BB58751|nr:alpha/beta fold hydrolase [Agaribacterium haliotis]
MNLNTSSIHFFALAIWLFGSTSYAEGKTGDISPGSSCTTNSEQTTGVNESGYVQIGGIKQWITIKGENCLNPIVLLLHGGPGNPLSLYHESLFQNWESEFTIVHWDQRGSGKTYEANQELGELTIDRLENTKLDTDLLVSDGLEVTDYIRKKFKREKIIISGTSWGSVLAVKMAFTAPDRYLFYVGLSQLVNYQKNMKESYDLVKSTAIEKQDQAAIDILNSIGAPPWTSPRSFGKLRRIIRAYENDVVSKHPEFIIDKQYLSEKTRAAYFAGEEFSFVKFVGLSGDGMAQKVALDECCAEFKIPIYIIQGEKDLLTTPKVTKEFFDRIKAPSKEYVQLRQSGHDPNVSMLDKQLDILNAGIKTLVNKQL